MVHNDPDAWVASYWVISLVTKNWDLSFSMSIKFMQEEGVFELSKTSYLFPLNIWNTCLLNRPLSDWKFVSKSEVNIALWLASFFL